MNRKELIEECKLLGIKGYSKMRKAQLETLVHLKQSERWFSNVIDNGVIVIDGSLCDASLNDVIELKEELEEKQLKEKPKKKRKQKKEINI